MVARITTPASLQETLNYNEHKARKGAAVCIAENNFLLPVDAMNFYQKLAWFKSRNELNTRATSKTLHVSLNFAPTENFTAEKLTRIAHEYMQRIGFGEQPYLVYQHIDAGHPHIHIVATTIREDGTRINTHNIGRNQSEAARKLIEEKYGLVKAGKLKQEQNAVPETPLARLEYGKAELKRSIANVLKQVLNLYNYTSIPELNAVLGQYGVMADRGTAGSFTERKNGLLYRILDEKGSSVGVPIKSSSIAGKPTLAYLEKKFVVNAKTRPALKVSLQVAVDECLKTRPGNLQFLMAALSAKGIRTVLRQNAEGRIYGITFVDNKNRSVFNGSEIGKSYSIAGLTKQFESFNQEPQGHRPDHLHKEESLNIRLLDPLLKTENESNLIPHQLRRKKKRRSPK